MQPINDIDLSCQMTNTRIDYRHGSYGTQHTFTCKSVTGKGGAACHSKTTICFIMGDVKERQLFGEYSDGLK